MKTALQRLDELHEAAHTKYKQTGNSYYEGEFTAYDMAMQVVESTGWQPIATAPRDGTFIKLWREPSGSQCVAFSPIVYASWNGSSWVFNGQSDIFNDGGLERFNEDLERGDHFAVYGDGDFTHWMPIETTPQERE